jgi:competence protein ComEC
MIVARPSVAPRHAGALTNDAGVPERSSAPSQRRRSQADALKVGHHGSRYASTTEFAAAVHPRIAVISVDRHNTFGHPAVTTIEMWHQSGANVLRTDECGAISLSIGLPTTTMLRCASL